MAPHEQIPNEILLEIISHFTLKSLITSRGVSRQWCRFIHIADMHPARRALLDLYLRVVNSPWFIRGRPWVLAKLRQFDREAYIHALSQYRCRVPDDFAIWILEWPARAAFRSRWPGLPDTEVGVNFSLFSRATGMNCLGTLPPTVYAITYVEYVDDEQSDDDDIEINTAIPALAICDERYDAKTWLLLDESEMFHGKVLRATQETTFRRIENPLAADHCMISSWLEFLEAEKLKVDGNYERLPSDYVTPPPSPPTYRPEPFPYTIPPEWEKIAVPEIRSWPLVYS